HHKMMVMMRTTAKVTGRVRSHWPRAKEPGRQNITERVPSAESEAKSRKDVGAGRAEQTATPAMSKRTAGNCPAVRATKNINAAATAAPIKAEPCSAKSPKMAPAPKRMAIAAPVDAPELMPKVKGSASILRTTACKMAPATASPAPTATPK